MPRKPPVAATGVCRLEGNILTVTTNAKRGKKIVKNETIYRLSDARPDARVAYPAVRMEKVELELAGVVGEKDVFEFVPTGDVYHVHCDQWGVACDCPHATYRVRGSRELCKHAMALVAVGLMPSVEDLKG